MSADANGALVILLVEDNAGDVVFFREALAGAQIPAALHVAGDGVDALRFLLRQELYADAPRPDVVVLDLNLPVKNGQEVMLEMAADPELNTIPVAILTTSAAEECVCDVYPRGRCLYFTKTPHFHELEGIVRQIAAHARAGQGPR
jgi:two-component system response regulator